MMDTLPPSSDAPKASDLLEEVRQLTEGLDEDQRARLMETIRTAAVSLPAKVETEQPNYFDPNWRDKLKSELATASKRVQKTAKMDPFSVSSIALSAAAIILIGLGVKAAMTGSMGSFAATLNNLLSGSSGAGFAAAGIVTLGILWLQSKVRRTSHNIDIALAQTIDLLNSVEPPRDGGKQ